MVQKIIFPITKVFTPLTKKYQKPFRLLIFLITTLVIVAFYPNQSSFKYDYRKNKPWLHEDLIAPFDFPINKSESDLKQERHEVKRAVAPSYFYDSINTATKKIEIRKALNDCYISKMPVSINANERTFLAKVMDSIFDVGIIQNANSENSTNEIQLIQSGNAQNKLSTDFFTIVSADIFIQKQLKANGIENLESKKSFLESFLMHNIIYDGETTAKELQLAYENISSTHGLIQKGERVIAKGELVTPDKFLAIRSLELIFKQGENTHLGDLLFYLGKLFLVFIIMSILYFYIFLFDKKVFYRLKRLALLSMVFISMIVPAFLILRYSPDYILAFPFCLFAISNKVFFSSRVSILSFSLAILLVGTVISGGFEFVLFQSLVGIGAILSLKTLYRRAQFLSTTLVVFVLYQTIHILRTMMLDNGFEFLNTEQMWLFSISAGLTLLAYPYIFILERSFKLVTDFTLLELSNTNLPLLRELAAKAPGTFLHSVLVSNIAEEVIHKINGNMLLVRTGALYHDIGKLANPTFFIENQHGLNPHDDLLPNESAAIIINHVAQGIIIGRKHKLPDEILGFIRTHHGTRKTIFFYNKFIINNPEAEVKEAFFTYPGPTPRSKEEAVLMLADIFEAATRSMKDQSRENITAFVENMVDKLIADHQFDEADITFKDLKIIKETFKMLLINIYHKRIEYPKI